MGQFTKLLWFMFSHSECSMITSRRVPATLFHLLVVLLAFLNQINTQKNDFLNHKIIYPEKVFLPFKKRILKATFLKFIYPNQPFVCLGLWYQWYQCLLEKRWIELARMTMKGGSQYYLVVKRRHTLFLVSKAIDQIFSFVFVVCHCLQCYSLHLAYSLYTIFFSAWSSV